MCRSVSSTGIPDLRHAWKERVCHVLNIVIHGNRVNIDRKGVQISTGVDLGNLVPYSEVDAFQGGERDIVIVSSVRTAGTGFIDSAQRINVALTRARHHLLVVGTQCAVNSAEIRSPADA